MSSSRPVLILIDGHSLAFRSYYALVNSRRGALRTSTGIPTSISYGFINALLKVIEIEKPQYVAIAFDLAQPTFRHKADSNYKANRKETPDDFIPDMENLQQLLAALNLTIATVAGYEADDVLGTLAQQGINEGYKVKIYSGDRDLFQLVDDAKEISILYSDPKAFKKPGKNYFECDHNEVIERLKITPEQVIDYKALCGDKSDNIPGVKGIGDKTAIKLLREYETLDNIYENLDQIKGAVKQKLATDRDNAFRSRFLATIALDTPIEIKLTDCKLQGFNPQQVLTLLEKLELRTFRDNIKNIYQFLGGDPETYPKSVNQQLSLFDTSQDIVAQNSNSINIDPLIVDTEAKLQQLISILKKHTNTDKPVAWDTETTSLEPHNAELVGIGCCWGEATTDIAYIPTHHTTGNHLEKQQVLSALKPILESCAYPKAFQNTKFDRLVFHYQGIKLAGVVFDTMLASYLLAPQSKHNLTDLSQHYNIPLIAKKYEDLDIPEGKTIADLEIAQVAEYCGIDAYATYNLVDKLKTDLEQVPEIKKLLLEVEQPLEIVLSAMETVGIKIDTQYLKQFSQQIKADLDSIEKQAYSYVPDVELNLNSPKQLSELLFDKLNLNKRKSRKTKTGYSTAQPVLEKLQGAHPIIDSILEYRTLHKLYSTYVEAIPKLVRKDTNRVHTEFNQTVVETGRLSSSNPNLQNIPIRTEFSRQIRQAFIPEAGWLLVAADYSQIELRILAHLSQEPVLVDAYRNSLDVHSVTAKLLFEKDEITPEERRLGKIINFGVIYGMGAQRFSRESGFSSELGKEFINKYRQRYAKVFDYLEGVKKEAVTQGFVQTILGRRRYFTFVSETLQQLRGKNPQSINLDQIDYSYQDAQQLRAAANATIQGSSADIIKIAMVKLHQVLEQYQARLLLQVHDELVFEMPPDEWSQLENQIKSIMENAVSLSIPLVVDIHAGNNWMEAK
ncbi:MAG: DNA polymerase I [Xenococcaceae cyanobacterium MO_167.B27]|nr:DNA polymerase I [Xenococcaceae cyanobacterium MO_167.B27]